MPRGVGAAGPPGWSYGRGRGARPADVIARGSGSAGRP
ncbi:hypothetical protein T261_06991 [Streptomyces lydicus]|nr:hypothetical protein T261_06991 [Streptomyces lydicus]